MVVIVTGIPVAYLYLQNEPKIVQIRQEMREIYSNQSFEHISPISCPIWKNWELQNNILQGRAEWLWDEQIVRLDPFNFSLTAAFRLAYRD